MESMRVVHYLNQFFGGIGGEDAAGAEPQIKPGAVGPGRQLQARLGERFEIVATAICGDNAFADDPAGIAERLIALIAPYRPQLVIAGPSFNAGRYGQGCGQLCAVVQEKLEIPALTGMYEENPAVEQFRDRVLIARTAGTARHMGEALYSIAALAARLARGETIVQPAEAGCFARGLKRTVFRDDDAAKRAVDMLMRKIAGQPFVSEISVPKFDRVTPARMAASLANATVALVTDGGLVAKGNPERMPTGYTDRMTAISVTGRRQFATDDVEVHHFGYNTQFVSDDANRLVPLDVMRDLEREGVIGKLSETVYSTAGAGMSLANARKVGREIGQRLLQDGAQAAILTST